MKTLTLKNTKFFAAVVGMIFALGNVACDQNKGGGSPAPAPVACVGYGMPGYNPACVNQAGMPGGMVQLMSVVSSSGFQDFNMSLQLGGSGTTPPQPGVGYNGPVAIQGTLQITNPNQYCGAMPGVYQVTTLQQGQMQGTSISQMMIQATGPAMIQMQVAWGIQYVTGRLSLGMNLVVNGQPCGQLLTN